MKREKNPQSANVVTPVVLICQARMVLIPDIMDYVDIHMKLLRFLVMILIQEVSNVIVKATIQ